MTAFAEPSPLAERARLVGRALALGAAAGLAVTVTLAVVVGPVSASEQSFAVGALAFGFGLLGWSGAILFGTGYLALQDALDRRTDWTERSARRAMARIGAFGAGWMVGASVTTLL